MNVSDPNVTTPPKLDYAAAGPRRIATLRRAVIVISLVAIAAVGKLCWEKFAPTIQRNLEDKSSQDRLLRVRVPHRVSWAANTPSVDLPSDTKGPTRAFLISSDAGPRREDPGTDPSIKMPWNLRWPFSEIIWVGDVSTERLGDAVVVVRTYNVKFGATTQKPQILVQLQNRVSLFRSYGELSSQFQTIDVDPPFELTNPRHTATSPNRIEWGLTTPTASGRLVLTIRDDGRAELFADLRDGATTRASSP